MAHPLPIAPQRAGGTPRLVLDTNVCLDLYVFDDPRVHALRSAIAGGGVLVLTDTACRDEWLRVLAYPRLGLDPVRRADAAAQFDAQMRRVGTDAGGSVASWCALPRCPDPDDQKFLELARRVDAHCLLSRDAHLLALDRRTRRDGGFRVLTPWAWAAEAAR